MSVAWSWVKMSFVWIFINVDAYFFDLVTLSDAADFKDHIKPNFINEMLLWTCHDECTYHCMWRTTNAFVSREWPVPQFYGKWPFKRMFGIQEPASVLFSFLNLVAHWRMIRKFRREVRNDSPMYYTWHIFSAVSAFDLFFYALAFSMRIFPTHFDLCYQFVCLTQICINGWICSIIFHTRDFPLTELLDYGFAYSMVLANFCCMILRW